jgi:hypothetical protein
MNTKCIIGIAFMVVAVSMALPAPGAHLPSDSESPDAVVPETPSPPPPATTPPPPIDYDTGDTEHGDLEDPVDIDGRGSGGGEEYEGDIAFSHTDQEGDETEDTDPDFDSDKGATTMMALPPPGVHVQSTPDFVAPLNPPPPSPATSPPPPIDYDTGDDEHGDLEDPADITGRGSGGHEHYGNDIGFDHKDAEGNDNEESDPAMASDKGLVQYSAHGDLSDPVDIDGRGSGGGEDYVPDPEFEHTDPEGDSTEDEDPEFESNKGVAFPDLLQLALKAGSADTYCDLCHKECPSCTAEEDGCPVEFQEVGDTHASCEKLEGAFPAGANYGPVAGLSKSVACSHYCTAGTYCPMNCAGRADQSGEEQATPAPAPPPSI